MLKSYLTLALRNLSRQKAHSISNIGGLTLGVAVFMFIMLFVRHELMYDRFNERADRLYRLIMVDQTDGSKSTTLPGVVASQLLSDFPEVESAMRVGWPGDKALITAGGKQGYESGNLQADSTIFEMLTLRPVWGDLSSAFRQPESIVLTEPLARKYFGDANPVGQIVTFGAGPTSSSFTVTAVIEEVPSTSHLQFSMLRQYSPIVPQSWLFRSIQTYILLRESTDVSEFIAKLPDFIRRNAGDNKAALELQPITEIYFNRNPGSSGPASLPIQSSYPIEYLYLLSAGALMILLIACVNYSNLATARFIRRAREVGVRKVVGAQRGKLIGQFLFESTLTTVIALLLAVTSVELLLPTFNSMLGVDLAQTIRLRETLPTLGLIGILVALFSGAYPALALSGVRTVRVLKGNIAAGTRGIFVRNVLTVFQFAASIALIAAALIVHHQMQYVRSERLHIQGDEIIMLRNHGGQIAGKHEVLIEELLSRPGIASVSYGSVPGTMIWATKTLTDSTTGEEVFVSLNVAGPDYLETLGLKLKAGRFFNFDGSDQAQRAVIVNEAAVRWLGMEDPIGRTPDKFRNKDGPIIGVIEDFHMSPLQEAIYPVVIYPASRPNSVMVRVKEGQISEGLASIHSVWNHFVPDVPLNHHFLDDWLDEAYRAELRMERIFSVFGTVAIAIACLGLYGLAFYMAEQRTKEIGIRKVLGASVANLVALLSKDFIRLVLIAFIVAVPVAYFAMSRWLEDFAYRIEIGPGIFLLAGGMALLIALATVSYQAVKAALADPVKSLRYE